MKTLHDIIISALLKVRDKLARAVLALLRPVLEEIYDNVNRIQQTNISTALLHQKVFLKYKNIYSGKDVAVLACGPTLNEYVPMKDVVNIGVNRAYRDSRIEFDYLFMIDGGCFKEDEYREVVAYRTGKCRKFFGLTNEYVAENQLITSESVAAMSDAERFRTDAVEWLNVYHPRFAYDLSSQPLADFGSCVFSAIQFALWTNPKRLFLVGCDCTNSGHFYNQTGESRLAVDRILDGYCKLVKFAKDYYPNTEIISINPVGLKGLFRDWYLDKGSLD